MVDEVGREQSYMDDRLAGMLRMGLGFGIDSVDFPAPTPTMLHWGGFGGSAFMADPATGLAVGYAPNKMLIDPTPEGRIIAHPRLMSLWDTVTEVSARLG